MHIVVPAGGVGGSRFIRGLLAALPQLAAAPLRVTVIGNTADDITLMGLRVCPDLDTVMYALGGAISESQGWGRDADTWTARDDLQRYADAGIDLPTWFGLGDLDLATHLARTSMLAAGATLSEATAALCRRWALPVTLLPMTDQAVETHVLVGGEWVHFQDYWVRRHAAIPAAAVEFRGMPDASPAPGVLDAIASADVVLLPPSNPVVSLGPILAVPGVREALVSCRAPVVGVSPIIGGAAVRGMADKLLPAIGVDVDAAAVALHYGPELLDGWLVADADAPAVATVQAAGIACRAVPLLMTSVPATAAMARAALELAGHL